MSYTPKKGDRVRVTVEGEVTFVNDDIGRVDLQDGWTFDYPSKDRAIVTIEKLQDPEPQWVNGDVIEVEFERTAPGSPYGPRKAALLNDEWYFADTGDKAGPWFTHNHWPNIKILYKADAA